MKKMLLRLAAGAAFGAMVVGCVNDIDDTPVAPVIDQQSSDEDGYWTGPEFSSDYKSDPNGIYSLRNVQKALDILADEGSMTRAGETTLKPTHHYVRFLPQNEADIYILHDSLNLDIFHYPFDREMTPEESEKYLNEEINGYGWQYCLVEPDFPMPTEMKWELLDYAYLQPDDEETMTRSGKSYQLPADVYSAVIDKSVEITGTGDDTPETRGPWQPSGSIKYMSGLPNEPNPVPLQGVYVRANTALNTGNTYTRADGTFTITKGAGGKFRNKVHYMVIWYRSDDTWKIHDKVGKAKTKLSSDKWIKAPWNPVFQNNEFAFCAAIHRALYEYFYGTRSSVAGLRKIKKINILEKWGQASSYPAGSAGGIALDKNNQIEIYGKIRRKNANGIMDGDLVVPTQAEVFAETLYMLGGMSFHNYHTGDWKGEDLLISWSIGVQHAYMRSISPSFKRSYYSNTSPAVAASLLNNGLTLAQLQTVWLTKNPYNLAECRSMVKTLRVLPDSRVDQIFNNPTVLF